MSNEEMNGIMKIVKPLEESGLLIKGVSNTTKNKTKERILRVPSILLDTLRASLSGNLSTGKRTSKAGNDTVRAGQKC